MTGDRLLWLAEQLCGATTRRQVFEPLVADWQRELLDTRGRSKRATVLMRGGVAFIVTLAICGNPFRGDESVPARRFLVAVIGFALAATLIQLAPFQLLTNQQLRFAPYALRWEHLLYSPRYFATGVAFAFLPAAMLVARRIKGSTFAIGVGVSLMAAFFVSKAIAPQTAEWRQALARQEMIAHLPAAAQKNWQARWQQSQLAEHERRLRDETGAWAHMARIERHEDAAFAVMAAALALLGLAIGRARKSPPPMRAAAAWWFFVWMAYQLLQFWARQLKIVVPTPAEVAIWIPPVAVLIVALIATREDEFRLNPQKSA
jgi:hypothetical protein